MREIVFVELSRGEIRTLVSTYGATDRSLFHVFVMPLFIYDDSEIIRVRRFDSDLMTILTIRRSRCVCQ